MKIISSKALVLAVMFLFIGASFAPSISSDEPVSRGTIYVDDDADSSWYDETHVRTIQEGINNASSGDTVYVYEGTYFENISIYKIINLVGEDKSNTIIDGFGKDTVVNIYENSVNITNFSIKNSGLDYFFDSGICLYSVKYCNIKDNNITNTNYAIIITGVWNYEMQEINISGNSISNNNQGIMLYYSVGNIIMDNVFQLNGITISGDSIIQWNTHNMKNNIANGKPIRYYKNQNDFTIPIDTGQLILANCSQFTIENLNIDHVETGILLGFSSKNKISLNNINNNSYHGIGFEYSCNNTILDNNIQDNQDDGIELFQSNNNSMYENNISNNIFDGIIIINSNNNSMYENYIVNSTNCGIILYNCTNNSIYGNNIKDNHDDGIYLSTNSDENSIYDNNIFDNNDDGIYFYSSNNYNLIYGNNIINNTQDGISFYSSNDNNSISGNNISKNRVGIRLFSSNNNIAYDNIFSNTYSNWFCINSDSNEWNISKTSGQNIIGGPYLGGNYWSNYSGEDTTGDRLGDTDVPYGPGDKLPLTALLNVEQSNFDEKGFPIRHALDGDWAGAQNFTPTVYVFTKSEVYLRKFGTPEFNLTVELRKDHPQGTLIDALKFTPEEVPSSWEWFPLNFVDTSVESDTNLFIVIPPAPSGVTTSFGYEWGYAFGDQYPDGSFWFTRDGGGLWRDLPTMYEFCFRVYGYS